MNDERLTRLEEKLAYQEHHIQSLNDTVYAQQQTLEAVQREQQRLAQQLEQVRESSNDTPQDETPPHY